MLNQKVRILATGETGVVKAVLPDKDGYPCQVHVKVEGTEDDPYALPYVLAVHEIVPLDVERNN